MKRNLIIGGAGFIGVNTAEHLLKNGEEVVVLDNFSRKGTEENFKWLKDKYSSVGLVRADIRTDQKELEEAIKDKDAVYHLAAQVAVTTSVKDPREDFEINALGTFNVLEAMRNVESDAALIYSSTNKVYGGMEEIKIVERNNRWEYRDFPKGIPESMQLDFHSPYGCSKGCGDQYVRDYARIYGLNTVVLRQSCILGPRQFGVEDQGWVAWFTIAAILGKPITIYGDGKQIRDLLYINDLVDAFEICKNKISKARGKIYNIGGGPNNTLSLLELVSYLEKKLGKKPQHSFDKPRPGDQPVYVSDIEKAKTELGWEPKVNVQQGLDKLFEWVQENTETIQKILG